MWKLTGKVEDRSEPISEAFFSNFKNRGILSEAASKTGKLYPVYIILFSNDTKFGKLIRLATGSEYSHAVVSLDSTMNNMYSFSDIPYNEAKFFCAGFVRESIWSPEYELNRHFRVLVTFVDKTGYDKMQKKIDYFIEHYKDYDYNDIGLIQYYFNFKNTKKHDETKKMKWFCSEFTAKIINSSGEVEGFDDVLQSPEDLLTASPNVIDLGKFTIPEFKEKDLIAKTKAAEKEFRKHSTLPKDVITEDADEFRYEAIDEAALADLFKKNKAKKKEKKFDEREVQQYTYNIDWKKLYDEFVKLFPKNNPKIRFDLFNVFVRDYFVPFKVSATNMTEKYIEEMRKVHKYVKNGIIKLIDAISATIFYEDDRKKEGAVVWPENNAKSITEAGIFSIFKNDKQNTEKLNNKLFIVADEMIAEEENNLRRLATKSIARLDKYTQSLCIMDNNFESEEFDSKFYFVYIKILFEPDRPYSEYLNTVNTNTDRLVKMLKQGLPQGWNIEEYRDEAANQIHVILPTDEIYRRANTFSNANPSKLYLKDLSGTELSKAHKNIFDKADEYIQQYGYQKYCKMKKNRYNQIVITFDKNKHKSDMAKYQNLSGDDMYKFYSKYKTPDAFESLDVMFKNAGYGAYYTNGRYESSVTIVSVPSSVI